MSAPTYMAVLFRLEPPRADEDLCGRCGARRGFHGPTLAAGSCEFVERWNPDGALRAAEAMGLKLEELRSFGGAAEAVAWFNRRVVEDATLDVLVGSLADRIEDGEIDPERVEDLGKALVDAGVAMAESQAALRRHKAALERAERLARAVDQEQGASS